MKFPDNILKFLHTALVHAGELEIPVCRRVRCASVALLLCATLLGAVVAGGQETDALTARLQAGRSLLQRGELVAAGVEYRAFLAEGIHRAANARALSGDLEGAASAFEESLAFAGNEAAIQLDYAAALLDLKRPVRAKEVAGSVIARQPDNARAHALLGVALLDDQDYVRAKASLENAAKLGWKDAWRQLAVTCFRLRQVEDARNALNHAVEAMGDTPEAHLEIGLAYYYGDYPREAISEFQKALAQDRSSVDAHYYLGLAYLGHNEEAGYEQAVPEFRAALSLEPGDSRSRYMLGHIALKQREFAAAEKELAPLVTANPADRRSMLALAELYQETGRDGLAEEILRKLTSLSVEVGDAISIRAHYIMGRLLQKTGRTDEGTAEIAISARLRREKRGDPPEPVLVLPAQREQSRTYLSQISPVIADVYNDLGTIAAGREDYDAAVSYYDKSAQWNPQPELNRTIGLIECRRERFSEAVRRLKPYLQEHAADQEVRYALAMSLFLQKDYTETLRVLRVVEGQMKVNPAIAMAFGVSLAKTGDIARGIEVLHNVARTNPELVVAHLELGHIYSSRGENDSAADEYRKALALSPGDASIQYHLGLALLALHQSGEAERWFHEASQKRGQPADLYYQLGMLQLNRGDLDDAMHNLEIAGGLAPNDVRVHQALADVYRKSSRPTDANRERDLVESLNKQSRKTSD